MSYRTVTTIVNQLVRPWLGGVADKEDNYANTFLAEDVNLAIAWLQNLCDQWDADGFMVKTEPTAGVIIASTYDYTEANLTVTTGSVRDVRYLDGNVTAGTPPPGVSLPYPLIFHKTDLRQLYQIRKDVEVGSMFVDRYFYAWDREARLLRMSHTTDVPGTTMLAGAALQMRYSYFHTQITAAMLANPTDATLLQMPESAYSLFALRTAMYALARQEQFLPRAQHLLIQLGAESVPGRGIPISETNQFKVLEAQIVGGSDAKGWPTR